ncbi:hypothetical protein RUND412_002696 [Rhizina undulata]
MANISDPMTTIYNFVLVYLAVNHVYSMVSGFANHANPPAWITLVVPGEVIPLILGLVALGTGYLVRLCWLLVRWAPWGIGFWYFYHTQTKETSWFRVVITPFIWRRISQRVRRCHEPEHGLFPLPVSQELKTPGHGSVRVIPAGKAPGHGCARVNSLQADKGPPKPTTSLTASDDDIDLIAKEADARAKAQLAAEADEEWRIWIITNPEAYAQARAGAAMAIWRNQMASIQHQHELVVAETGPPLRMQVVELHPPRLDQQWSPQVVPAMYQEVEMVDVAPVEVEVRMVTGPMDMGVKLVEVISVGVMPVEMAGVQKKEEREEMNRRYRCRFD